MAEKEKGKMTHTGADNDGGGKPSSANGENIDSNNGKGSMMQGGRDNTSARQGDSSPPARSTANSKNARKTAAVSEERLQEYALMGFDTWKAFAALTKFPKEKDAEKVGRRVGRNASRKPVGESFFFFFFFSCSLVHTWCSC